LTHPLHDLLSSLPHLAGVPTRQISAENPTGAKGGASRWDPDPTDPDLVHSAPSVNLGRGWKVRPFIRLRAGETATLGEIPGPGCINQLWITSDLPAYRALVLRIFWDGESDPSVEVPLGDFFTIGHDSIRHLVSSLPVVVGPPQGCGSYWQMPFRHHALLTLENNEGPTDAEVVAYRILYKEGEVAEDAAYFHAQWRRSLTRREHPEHTIVDGVAGRGLYVGTYLAWTALSSGWWGEGEVKFYIDGDGEYPTMADNGTEDYFGGAWGFSGNGREQPFSSPFVGLAVGEGTDGPRKFSLYRWHLLDSIGFAEDLRVAVQTLGWWPDRTCQPLTDDVASVAYWYQLEPHNRFPALPALSDRWER
jgi:hypothetical protein